jgi:hypothetical protein
MSTATAEHLVPGTHVTISETSKQIAAGCPAVVMQDGVDEVYVCILWHQRNKDGSVKVQQVVGDVKREDIVL